MGAEPLSFLAMNTEILLAKREESIAKAIECVKRGGLIAFPTDTVYGVGGGAFDPKVIHQIIQIKERGASKAIPILLGDKVHLKLVVAHMSIFAKRLAEAFWPGPLTLVVPRHPDLPENISPNDTIGVRMPDHPVALMLLKNTGPMAVTSANLSGSPDSHTAQEVLGQLGSRIDLILDGGKTPGGVPSTVVDCTGEHPVILRSGPLSLEDLLAVL